MNHPLNIFVPHCSGCLTDVLPHGDGLVAHGFITRLAERGHRLYVAAERVELSKPLPENVRLFPTEATLSSGAALFFAAAIAHIPGIGTHSRTWTELPGIKK